MKKEKMMVTDLEAALILTLRNYKTLKAHHTENLDKKINQLVKLLKKQDV